MLTIENFGTLRIIEEYLLNKFDKHPKHKKHDKGHFFERFAQSNQSPPFQHHKCPKEY